MWDLIVSVPDHCLSFYFGGERERGRNDLGANGKVGETTRGETTRGGREIGRNDLEANWKVGETTRIRLNLIGAFFGC